MKKLLLIMIWTSCSYLFSYCQELNLGFEKVDSTLNLPKDLINWSTYTHFYSVEIDTVTKHEGKNSLLLTSTKPLTTEDFTCFVFQVPNNFVGKTIELKGFLKSDKIKKGYGGLVMRIDDSTKRIIAFDNSLKKLKSDTVYEFDNSLGKRLTGTQNWTELSLKLKLDIDAAYIYIGPILTGKGELWCDDLSLFIDGKDYRLAIKK